MIEPDDLDERIALLAKEVFGFSIFDRKPDFWGEAWSRVRQIGEDFKQVRYPTASRRREAWDKFQSIASQMKEDARQHREKVEADKRPGYIESGANLGMIAMEAQRAWPWLNGFEELVAFVCGITPAEWLVDFAFTVMETLVGIPQKNAYQKRKEELQLKTEHLKTAFRLLSEKKRRMTPEDRGKAWDLLSKTEIELEQAWNELKNQQKKFRDERQKKDEEFRFRASQKRELISTVRGLTPSNPQDRERAKGMNAMWKQIGFAGREHEEALWTEFRGVLDDFWFEARSLAEKSKKEWEERQADFDRNYQVKRRLIKELRELDAGNRADNERCADIRNEWRSIRSAGRERDDDVWSEFKEALDDYFDRVRSNRRERLNAALANKLEHEEKLEEWISRDEASLEDAESKRGSAWSDSFREKMDSKIEFFESRLEKNRGQLSIVEEAIRDIRSKIEGLD